MITYNASETAALQAGTLLPRDFITFRPVNRSTGLRVEDNIWSGIETISADVVNPQTQLTETRTFNGAGALVSAGGVPRVGNLTVGVVNIALSQVDDHVDRLFREYNAKHAPVEMFRGFVDADTGLFVAPAKARFFGFIDDIEHTRAMENEMGSVNLTVKSLTQELTRTNSATRSDAYQKRRNPNDTFRKYTATIGERRVQWGTGAVLPDPRIPVVPTGPAPPRSNGK